MREHLELCVDAKMSWYTPLRTSFVSNLLHFVWCSIWSSWYKKRQNCSENGKKNRFHHLWDFLSMANLSIYIHTYIQVFSSHNFCSLGISYFSHVSIAFSASNNIRLRYQALVALGVCCLEPSHYIHFHQGISYRRIFWISLLFNTRGVLKK